jgi:HK97 family phage major capsid protein
VVTARLNEIRLTGIAADEAAVRLWITPSELRNRKISTEDRAIDRRSRLGLFEGERPASDELTIIFPERPFANEARALSAVVGASGQFTAPEGFEPAWNRVQYAEPMLRYSRVTRVEKVTNYREVNAEFVEGTDIVENKAVSVVDPTWSQIVHNPCKHTSGMIKVPHELPEGGGDRWAQQFAALMGGPIALRRNHLYTTGTGVSQPTGICTAVSQAGATVTALNSTSILPDELLSLYKKIGAGFWGPECRWMMHRDTYLALRELKDANGRYLFKWDNGKLDDHELIENYNMPTAASGNVSVIFGRLDYYSVVEWRDLRLVRTTERFAESDEEGWQAYFRTSGNAIMFSTEFPIVGLTHP